ncbi:MAG: helix-turn-helix transcriptional regulator [Lachnospiraceae bacterium]|nr:helix-turn-helix transcriptional regulator [Lachnospiraceae bacterium]
MVKNLRKLRLSRGISQQQLADVLGTSQQSVNKYENHSVEPDISALIKLADFFETTIDYLVGHISLPEQDIKEEMELTKEETKLILEYRHLSKDEKESIQLVLKNYLKIKKALEI